MPNARFKEEGTTSFVYSRYDPYGRYVFQFSPFDWFEGSLFTLILILSAILTLKEQVLEVKVKKIRAFPLKLDSLKRENVMDLVLVFVIIYRTLQ